MRIAFAWLDAQRTIKSPPKHWHPIKHIIENWAGRYVSSNDVEIAGILHPDIKGSYSGSFNLSARLTYPDPLRLKQIEQAYTQGYHSVIPADYSYFETEYVKRGAYEKPY